MYTQTNWRSSLRETLDRTFNFEERKDLAFDLGFNHEQLGLDKSCRELILKCERERKLGDLIQLCLTKRPNEEWPEFEISYTNGSEGITSQQARDPIDWGFLVNQIEMDYCSLVISNSLIEPILFLEQNLVQRWAEQIRYPIKTIDNLSRLAQYARVANGQAYAAKVNYLNFLKRCLLEEINGLSREPEAEKNYYAEREIAKLNFSDLVRKIVPSRMGSRTYHVLDSLAQLPLSVYITTSYHTVLEEALRNQGKDPITDFYRWSDQLVASHGDNAQLSGHRLPTEKEPLVYHLLGLDSNPASLVLTEDDLFDFFERASLDVQRADGLPVPVRDTFTNNTLVLLGYDLQNWPFRVVFRGPIKSLFRKGRRHLSYTIQINPRPEHGITNNEAFQQYVQSFFREYQFNLYWGETEDFVDELTTNREGKA